MQNPRPQDAFYIMVTAHESVNAWAQCRNLRVTDKIDPEILTKPVHSTELLCTVLSLFLAEARKVNGERYPPKTLFQLMAGPCPLH